MDKGITLLVLGDPAYGLWARNMAASIKYYSPDIPIQVIYGGNAMKGVNAAEYFRGLRLYDELTPMDFSDYYVDGRFEPGYAKTNMFKYLAFEHSIYIDVDGVCIKPIDELFEVMGDKPFASHVWGYGTINDKSFGDLMYWADAPEIWEHYGLSRDARLPFLNTSLMSWNNSEFGEILADQVQKNIANPLPLSQMRELWGKGNQPDELYYNVALAQLDYDPAVEGCEKPIYFRTHAMSGKAEGLEVIREKHYFIGLWGGNRFNHRSCYSYYDGVLRKVWASEGITHSQKAHNLMSKKFVLNH